MRTHSLRAGCATGASGRYLEAQDQAQTGHASDAMVGRYDRDGELRLDNAEGMLL
jgi:hypothetical protein